MALSGTFGSYPVLQFGLYCEWRGVPNMRTNSTRITVNVYLQYYRISVGQVDGTVTVDGISQNFTSPEINNNSAETWTRTLLGSFVQDISHNAEGEKNDVTISVSWDFNNTYSGTAVETITATTTVDLDKIIIYHLSIDEGTHSNIIVDRTYSYASDTGELSDGSIIYNGDRLRVVFTADEGYQIVVHTVNGFAFTSDGTLMVDGDVSVVSTAQTVIKQAFSPENMQCFTSDGEPLRWLHQWDKDVSITIKDVAIDPPPVFQFANRLSKQTIPVTSVVSGDDLVVQIPNALLERAESVFAYIHRNSGGGITRTLGSIYIPVRARIQPEDNQNSADSGVSPIVGRALVGKAIIGQI